MENVPHELFFIVDRKLQDLKLNLLFIVETFPDELKIGDGLVAVEVLVFVLDLEDEFVD